MKSTTSNRFIEYFMIAGLLFVVLGCAGADPTIPNPENQVTNTIPAISTEGNRLLWGMWQFRVDLLSESIEIIPLREISAHLNVVTLLEPAPLVFLFIDESSIEVDMDELTVEVDVLLKHPLPGYPEYTGFDVRGILISNGSWTGNSFDAGLILPEENETRLGNADGYTRWWNPTEFTGPGILGYQDGLLGVPDYQVHYTATVNGYKYFADGLGADAEVLSPIVLQSRGRFSSSSTNKRHYTLRFGPSHSDFMVFNYSVDASWERPVNIPPQTFDDFPISANALEPFHIEIQEETNSLYYDPELIDCPTSGGVLRLLIDIATWHGPDGIGDVLLGSSDLGMEFINLDPVSTTDIYGAHIVSYIGEIATSGFATHEPQVLIAVTSPLGSYTSGPENLPISFDGPTDTPLALYQVYIPTTGTNSPPQVGPVTGLTNVVAGEPNTYEVTEYYDCQDMNEDLVIGWEDGDSTPPDYDDGFGNIDGVHPFGNGSKEIIFPDAGTYRVDVRVTDLDGGHGYAESSLVVNVTLPPLPVFPPEGVDLKLNLKRTVLNSYEYTHNPSDIPHIMLYWDGSNVSGVIGEWVIYRDRSPYNDTWDWEEIGTSPGGQMDFKNEPTGDFGYNSGASYFFKVHARAIAGNPSSESIGSTELAFIEFENAEPDGATQDQNPWIMGYGGYESYYYRQWERPGYGGAVAGGCWMMDPDSPYMRRHTWSVIASPEFKILTDPSLAVTTSEWYIELIFGGQVIPMNECWDNYARLSVGTVPDDPSTHNVQSTYVQYEEARPSDCMSGEPYFTSGYWSHNNSRFDETAGNWHDRYGWGKNEYGWPFKWARFRLYDLDPFGLGRTRAAIGFGSGATTDSRARPRVDEIAVIIY